MSAAPRLAQDRWVLGLSGALLGVLSLIAPAGYLLVSLRYQAGAVETEAAAVAQAMDALVTANPDLWRFEQVRLEEILQRRVAPGPATEHRVFDLAGTLVARNGVAAPSPVLRRSAPILDAGLPLGRVEVGWSARPAVLGALLLALVLAPVAGGAFLLIRAALRRAAAARDAAEAQLREAQRLEAVGRLASGVAHDFNNLLAAVIGFSRDLRRELPVDSPHLETVDEILSVAQRGGHVTRSLLAFSRQQALGLRRVDAGELLRGLERLLRGTLAPGQTLQLDLASDQLPLEVDVVQLELALVNLAANARDAMAPSGTLRIETSAVTLDHAAVLAPGGYVRLAVHDDGTGMDEETRLRVFDPFFTTKPVGRGVGLGLAIAHGVVQQHRGVIEVESALGRGTTFSILLPQAAPGPVAAEGEGARDEGQAPRGRDELLLVAEDDRHVRRLLAKELRRAGYQVVEAADGEEAVRVVDARRHELDLVLVDLAMPRRSGPEVLAHVRRLGPELPALILTGDPGDLRDAPGAEVLLKPVEPDALLRAVRRAIDG